jgi:hypothetical protein
MGERTGAAVGIVVLFCVSESPRVLRPLVVVDSKDGTVSGDLLVHPTKDPGVEWVLRTMTYRPSLINRHVWVQDAAQGTGLGQWQYMQPALRQLSKRRR